MHHDLKLLTAFFDAKAAGLKPWEARSTHDREFRVGDTVTFHEVEPMNLAKTGRTIGPESVVYLLEGRDVPGLQVIPRGVCVFTHARMEGGRPCL